MNTINVSTMNHIQIVRSRKVCFVLIPYQKSSTGHLLTSLSNSQANSSKYVVTKSFLLENSSICILIYLFFETNTPNEEKQHPKKSITCFEHQ